VIAVKLEMTRGEEKLFQKSRPVVDVSKKETSSRAGCLISGKPGNLKMIAVLRAFSPCRSNGEALRSSCRKREAPKIYTCRRRNNVRIVVVCSWAAGAPGGGGVGEKCRREKILRKRTIRLRGSVFFSGVGQTEQ